MKNRQTLEQKVRLLDNPELSIAEASRLAAKQLNANLSTIKNYILAKRKDHTSYAEYQAEQKGYSTIKDYHDAIAKDNGYDSYAHYVTVRKIVRSKTGKYRVSLQDRFENSIIFAEEKRLDRSRKIVDQDEELPHTVEELRDAIERLPKRMKHVIKARIYENKILTEIGKELNVSGEMARHIEKEAIKNLKNILEEKYVPVKKEQFRQSFMKIEDGEILLVHILSKLEDYQIWKDPDGMVPDRNKIQEAVRRIYHKGEEMRRDRVGHIQRAPLNKERLAKLRKKYFKS